MRESRKMPGQERIYTAGEKEYERWMIRKESGLAFSQDLLKEFRGLCESYSMNQFIDVFKD
jgi:LDH2 family malate/lactate/ureidoglycolate dehydrogenase